MRSIPLHNFEKLFLIPNLNFINLTKGIGNEQIKNFKFKNKLSDFSKKLIMVKIHLKIQLQF